MISSTYYRLQTKFAKVMFLHMSVCPGGISQHALQVVSQHALQQVWGGWYPSMPCRFPGPHPGGKLRGILPGGSPGPHQRGKLRGSGQGGGLQAHTQGWSIPACTEADPPQQLLLWAVRILLECILVCESFHFTWPFS